MSDGYLLSQRITVAHAAPRSIANAAAHSSPESPVSYHGIFHRCSPSPDEVAYG
ncbi:MAG: hypothetical protein VX589_04255 [Myxococcota bacterium]|nr:hypothetical protein [Myxococcota bacterium]